MSNNENKIDFNESLKRLHTINRKNPVQRARGSDDIFLQRAIAESMKDDFPRQMNPTITMSNEIQQNARIMGKE